MEMVEVVSGRYVDSTWQFETIESRMGHRRVDALKKPGHDQQHGMYRHYPPEEKQVEVDQVFHRVHGDAAPGTGIGVTMMQVVGDVEKRTPVEQSMIQVEVEGCPEQYTEGHDDDIDRGLAETDPLHVSRGIPPPGEALIQCPGRDAAGEAPEHVVLDLVIECETRIVPRHPRGIELVVVPLTVADVEPPVETAGEQGQ